MTKAASAKTHELALLRERSNHARSLENILTDTEAEQTAVAARFVDPDGVAGFLDALETTAQYANVLFEVTDVEETLGGGREVLRVSATSEGVWGDTLHALELIETLPFALAIDKVSLTQGGEHGWTAQISIEVHLATSSETVM